MTANEAARLRDTFIKNQETAYKAGLTQTFSQIEADIKRYAEAGKSSLSYEWDWYGHKQDQPKLKNIFPTIPDELYWYDGGDGRCSKATETGTLLINYFTEAGFNVFLYNGVLRISW